MKFSTSFGVSSTLKLSKYMILLPLTYKAVQWVSIDLYSSRFITSASSFILPLF